MDGVVARKPSSQVAADAEVAVEPAATQYVGRGGEKLAAALDRFGVGVAGRTALDVGASTGGFTDCLLQHGATAVVAVDVGTGQLHPSLRSDARVVVHEQTDVRSFTSAERFDLIVVDVSFISIARLAATLESLGHDGTDWLVLLKPQFEAGPLGRDRRGVVDDPAARADAVANVLAHYAACGLQLRGFMVSPIAGGAGNAEYLVWMRRTADLARVTTADHDGGNA